MQLRFRDMEWWMRRRQLPSRLRQRVRKYERERWAAITGDEEMEMIKDLPEGLWRDIKRYLCLELVKQVPLFHGMDELILDNICDRLRPLVFCGGEKVIREGDPVQRMVFILQGRLRSTQPLTKGVVAECVLGAGSFLGDELLSWCLRRPFVDRLPASSATFECWRPRRPSASTRRTCGTSPSTSGTSSPTTSSSAPRATTRPTGGRGRPSTCSSRGGGTGRG